MEGLDMNTSTQGRFAPALAGKIVTLGDARFDEARRAWNLAVDQQPAAGAVTSNHYGRHRLRAARP
jgi:hypothetical protein